MSQLIWSKRIEKYTLRFCQNKLILYKPMMTALLALSWGLKFTSFDIGDWGKIPHEAAFLFIFKKIIPGHEGLKDFVSQIIITLLKGRNNRIRLQDQMESVHTETRRQIKTDHRINQLLNMISFLCIYLSIICFFLSFFVFCFRPSFVS